MRDVVDRNKEPGEFKNRYPRVSGINQKDLEESSFKITFIITL